VTLLKTVPHTLDISNRTKNWSIYPKLVEEYDSVKKIKKIDGRFFSIVDPYRQCLLKLYYFFFRVSELPVKVKSSFLSSVMSVQLI